MFQHIIGAGTNAMGTDQGCYGLVAYDRFVKGKAALYDYSDVTFDTAPEAEEMTAILDLIPATRKAVAVAVTGISGGTKLSYNDGTNKVEVKYSAEISEKTGVSTYVALVDAAIPMEHFVNDLYFTIPGGNSPAITFGDSNGDGILNAQDALAAVDAWLRKGEAPDDDGILTMNVNGDSRINTFDALGIVEKFVSGSEYGVVTRAATITTNQ